MSALIEKTFDFQAAVYFHNSFLINAYEFTLQIEVITDSIHEQNVSMDRLKYFVYEVLENSVFVFDTEAEVIKKYEAAELKVCSIPDEPYDQIVALLLLLKTNAICEGRLKVTDITLTSKLSDDVKFKETYATAIHTFENSGWWHEPGPTLINEGKKKPAKEKVVKIKNNEWAETGLVWKEKKEKSKEILFSIDSDK